MVGQAGLFSDPDSHGVLPHARVIDECIEHGIDGGDDLGGSVEGVLGSSHVGDFFIDVDAGDALSLGFDVVVEEACGAGEAVRAGNIGTENGDDVE